MGVNLQETARFRDTLWPLSPDLKDEDRKTYCLIVQQPVDIRRLYLLGWEGLRTHVYDDGKGFMTVGVGFNRMPPGPGLNGRLPFKDPFPLKRFIKVRMT